MCFLAGGGVRVEKSRSLCLLSSPLRCHMQHLSLYSRPVNRSVNQSKPLLSQNMQMKLVSQGHLWSLFRFNPFQLLCHLEQTGTRPSRLEASCQMLADAFQSFSFSSVKRCTIVDASWKGGSVWCVCVYGVSLQALYVFVSPQSAPLDVMSKTVWGTAFGMI